MSRTANLEERRGTASALARAVLLAAAATLALACGSGSDSPAPAVIDDGGPIDPGNGNGDPGDGNGTPPRACNGEVTLRIRGVDPGPVTAFHLAVSGASFALEGAAPVDGLGAQTLDLLSEQAWRLGTLPYPEGATLAIATVGLAGGHATTTLGEVAFGACLAPLRIPIDLSNVHPDRCHVVIHLDLAGSVVASAGTGAGGATFIPNLAVFY